MEMTGNMDVTDALFKDLRMEYGLALRYLAVSNNIGGSLRVQIVPILQNLASDCISHSTIVKELLVERGEKTDNYFDSFSSDFSVMDKALHSSFLLERKMARDYASLARGEAGDMGEKLSALSRWEVMHMKEVKRAFSMVNKVAANIRDDGEDIEKKLREASVQKEDISTIGGIILLNRRDEEAYTSERRMLLAETLRRGDGIDDLKKVTDELLSRVGYEKIGTHASDALDSDAVELIWDRRDYAGYCIECGGEKEMKKAQHILLANGLPAVKGKCASCDSPVFTLV